MNSNSFFGIDFYPTSTDVVERMLMNADVTGKIILEPSAGSGNIVDVLNARLAKDVIACEIDDKLRKVLSGKCNVIASDFLSLTSLDVSHIDMIVMNPPFSRAEEHILHAYEIAPDGCHIISLCNYDMINRHRSFSTKRVQIMELISKYGFSDDFGECFDRAERRTDCRIGCINIFKPKQGDSEFDDFFFDATDDYERSDVQGIMPYNAIRDIVNRYVGAVRKFDAVMEASKEINDLASSFDNTPIKFGAFWSGEKRCTEITRDVYRKELQKAAWRQVFNKLDMERYVTKSVREQINRFVERQVNMPFTMANIYRVVEMIVATHGNRMEQTLVEAFDLICSFSADNSTAGEKWKTNSNYMVNRRFIVPGLCEGYHWGTANDYVELGWYSRKEAIEDIIRALCYVCGVSYEKTVHLGDFINNNHIEWGKWVDMTRKEIKRDTNGEIVSEEVITGFFRIRGYKKGTMHFEFIDEDVWAKFNQGVANIKGWQLPQNIRTKSKKSA